ncbi:MAG: copper resistance protein CopC/CopD [Pseudorhodoplanes sp.]|nr:copper resistance protein CopC/CopD [Pseudorhodoplanes sp.]
MTIAARAGRTAAARCAGLLLGALPAFWSAAAFGHASLVSSDPPGGAMVAAMPERAVLSFNEPVAPLALKLVTPGGAISLLAGAQAHDRTIAVALPRSAEAGTWLLSWRVISADGHPVGGTVAFSVGEPGGRAALSEESSRPLFRLAFIVAKVALYIALFIGIGGAFARAWIAARRAAVGLDALPLGALLLGFPALAATVGLQGLDALDVPADALAQAAVWRAGLETSWGITAIVAAFALFAGLFAAVSAQRGKARLWSALALAGAAAALSASGHASAASPQALMRPAVFVHATAVALWIGALIPLSQALTGDEAGATLRRFSRLAPAALAMLLVSGFLLAVVQLGRGDAPWATGYGIVLLVKLSLVLMLLLIAAYNRLVLTPRIAAGESAARAALRRSILAELVVVLAILAAAASWRFTPPPRALAAAAQSAEFVHIHGARAMADVTFRPAGPGRRDAAIVLQSGDFRPLDAKEISLVLSNEAAQIEPIAYGARRRAAGVWIADGVLVPLPGLWTIRVDVLIDDFEKVMLQDTVDLRR